MTDQAVDRATHWEQVYRTRNPAEVSWYQADPDRSRRLIRETGIALTDPILDVGGGASLLVDRLVEAGYRDVTVLDVATAALAQVRARLVDVAAVHFVAADVTRFEPSRRYALWHDRAVLHFLTDPVDRTAYLDTIRHALRPRGHVILATFGADGPTRCSGLPVERYDATRLQALLGSRFILRSAETERHLTPDGGEQQFQYAWFASSD
jgi:SAM-dependent methyltransferase